MAPQRFFKLCRIYGNMQIFLPFLIIVIEERVFLFVEVCKTVHKIFRE